MFDTEADQFEKGRFLTETQRAYLKGDYKPPSHNAEIQNRYKIRQRVMGALADLSFVAPRLSNEDIEMIFNPIDPSGDGGSYDSDQIQQISSIHRGLTDTLALLIGGVKYADSLYVSSPKERSIVDGYVHDFESIPDKEARKRIVEKSGADVLKEYYMTPDIDFDAESMLRKAIEHSARRHNERVVSVTVETEPITEDTDQLLERFENRENLTREQVRLLKRERDVSGRDIQEYYRERQSDTPTTSRSPDR